MDQWTIGTVVALAMCAASVIASESQQPAQFRAAIDLVHMDVSVLDNERRPVRGLRAEDFAIFEDGQPQSVSTFAAIDIPDAIEPSTPWMREVPPDTRRNDTLTDRRLFVMVMDDSAAELNVAALKATKLIARRFIEQLGPTDLMAIVFTLNNRNAQDYTSDRARLLAAVDKFNVGFRGMGDDFLYYRYPIEVLGKVADILAELPEQRKALVYVGQGVPLNPDEIGATNGRQALLLQRLREAYRKAQRANVTFYTIDTCGLRVEPMGPEPPRHTCRPGREVDFLRAIAAETGGYSAADTNNVEPGITQIFRENASYYLLGFRSTNPNADGKFRRIEVRVKRPGLLVRTRSGYTADKQKDLDKKAETEAEPLSVAISGLLPKRDVPMQVWAAPFFSGSTGTASVPIAVGLRLELSARQERIRETADLRIDAYSPDGKLKATHSLRTNVALNPGPEAVTAYEVLTAVSLKPGRYQLRIAASLSRLRRNGSVYVDVDVPDVSKAPLTWSGLAFQVSPSVLTATASGLRSGIPIAHTSKRLFAATDTVTAFARIHQGGKSAPSPVEVIAMLTDSEGRDVWRESHALAAPQFTIMRGADVAITVPISRLAPGSYRLRLEAKQGRQTAVRDSRFTVR
jgi:VWFA-related protein